MNSCLYFHLYKENKLYATITEVAPISITKRLKYFYNVVALKYVN